MDEKPKHQGIAWGRILLISLVLGFTCVGAILLIDFYMLMP
jgi:hypothetical protein